MGTLSPLGLLLKKPQFQGKIFTSTFLQAAVAGPILGIDFLRKLKLTVSPEISQIQFACLAAALPAIFLPSAARPAHPIFSAASSASPFFYLARHRSQLWFQFRRPLRRLVHSLLQYPHI
jgi:hypothetical protein